MKTSKLYLTNLLLFLFVLICDQVFSQQFYLTGYNDSTVNGPEAPMLYDIQTHKYIFITSHSNNGSPYKHQRLTITDTTGNIAQIKNFIYKKDTAIYYKNIFKIAIDKYLAVGIKRTVVHPEFYNIHLTCFDNLLNTLWEKTIELDTGKYVYLLNSILTSKNTLLVAGGRFYDTPQPAISNCRIFLYELTLNGDSIRYNEFYKTFDSTGYTMSVCERHDTAGYVFVNELGPSHLSFFYVDTNFQLLRNADNTTLVSVANLFSLGDGTFIQSRRFFKQGKHWHQILKYKDDMTYLYHVFPPAEPDTLADFGHMPAYSHPIAISPTAGVYSLEGTRTDQDGYLNFNQNYLLVTRLDKSLNMIWSRFIGGDAFNYIPISIHSAEEGSCMVLATRRSLDTSAMIKQENFIFKLDSVGTLTEVKNISNPQNLDVVVFPNPAQTECTIWMSNLHTSALFTLYSLKGEVLFMQQIKNGANHFDLSNVADANYYYTIVTQDGKKLSGKLQKR